MGSRHYLGYAAIGITEVVGEGYFDDSHESENIVFEVTESLEKVPRFAPFYAAFLSLGPRFIRRRALLFSGGNKVTILLSEFFLHVLAQEAAFIEDFLIDGFEKLMHLFRPRLLVLLPCSGQLTEMVRVAQAVDASITIIGLPVVVTEDAHEIWEDADFIHRFFAAFFMRVKERPQFVRAAVQPLSNTVDIHAGFVRVRQHRLRQFLLCRCFERLKQVIGLTIEVEERARAHRYTELV